MTEKDWRQSIAANARKKGGFSEGVSYLVAGGRDQITRRGDEGQMLDRLGDSVGEGERAVEGVRHRVPKGNRLRIACVGGGRTANERRRGGTLVDGCIRQRRGGRRTDL